MSLLSLHGPGDLNETRCWTPSRWVTIVSATRQDPWILEVKSQASKAWEIDRDTTGSKKKKLELLQKGVSFFGDYPLFVVLTDLLFFQTTPFCGSNHIVIACRFSCLFVCFSGGSTHTHTHTPIMLHAQASKSAVGV